MPWPQLACTGIRDSGPDSVTNPLVRSWADSWWYMLAALNVDWQRPRFSPISPPWPLPVICKWLTFTVQSGPSRSPHSWRLWMWMKGWPSLLTMKPGTPWSRGTLPRYRFSVGLAVCQVLCHTPPDLEVKKSHKSSARGHRLQEKMSYGQDTYVT